MFAGKHILLGVTGGIAAYKSAWLVRELIRAGAEVQVVMTASATKFITPLTLSTLSRREVIVEMFPPSPERGTAEWTRHIELGMWADVMLVAPATANTIAKLAHGLADDFLSTIALALRCPLAIAPAMDVDMYRNERTQSNIDALKQAGCFIIDPESGELASGLSGPGRLPEVDRLMSFLDGILAGARRDYRGRRVLVTAGPTQEPIDPVRYISNYSSGRMGFAVAHAAALRGAEVTLVSGPVSLRTPLGARRIDVRTAREMKEAVDREFDSADLVVMAAAVADFAPAAASTRKMQRESTVSETISLSLKRNPDILKSLGERKKHQVLVGFALETDEGLERAQAKLTAKHLDVIVLNRVDEQGTVFGSDSNTVTLMSAGGAAEALPKMLKIDIANEILSRMLPRLKAAGNP